MAVVAVGLEEPLAYTPAACLTAPPPVGAAGYDRYGTFARWGGDVTTSVSPPPLP